MSETMLELARQIANHLADLSGGRCQIRDEDLAAERDPATREILAGLLMLHEDMSLRAEHQREAAAALRRSEMRLRETLKSIGDGVIATDARGAVKFMNRVAEELTGWSTEAARGRPLEEVFAISDGESGAAVESPVRRTLREGVVVGLANHTVLTALDGTRLAIADSGAPIYSETGTLEGVVLVFRDQTAEREVEREAARGRALDEALAETSMMVLRGAPLTEVASEAVERIVERTGAEFGAAFRRGEEGEVLLLGASRMAWETLEGRDLYETARRHLAEEGALAVSMGDNLLTHVLAEGRVLTTEHAPSEAAWGGALPPGHPPIGALLAVPLVVDEETVGLITIANRREGFTAADQDDVSKLARPLAMAVRAQREEAKNASLEQQLFQAQRLESVGRLAGGVAHDFNNLLTVINSYSDLAIEGLRAGDPLRDDLQEIRDAGRRAARLTSQLLAFSRRQVLEPEVLDLNEVVTGLERMLRRVIGEDVDLRFVPAEGIAHTRADRGQLEQVLMNLVVNARDAMPHGGALTLETAEVELDAEYARRRPGVTAGAYVMMAVSDTGEGMDASTCAHIFEPFFTTKAEGRGTGLGLSTVYGIVKQSGGNIWVYSEPGKGTTFKVYLPVTAERGVASRPIRVPSTVEGSETVLLVEDEDAVRALAQRILESAGYRVLAAANGGEALLTCEQAARPIHLMLTDVVMPRMGGRQLADRLAVLRPDLRVLYMSGYTDNAIVHHGVLDSGTRFLAKPFTARTLLRAVRDALDE